MTPLQKRISKDFSQVQKRSNAMFQVFMQDVGELIDIATDDCLTTVASVLSMQHDLSYNYLQTNQVLFKLDHVLHARYENLSKDIEMLWIEKRKYFDLMSRLSMGFISRKASPPWVETSLNLKTELPKDGRFSPWKGFITYTFSKMIDHIIKEIERGALAEENLNQIMTRVRVLFNSKKKKNVREADYTDAEFFEDPEDINSFMRGPISIEEGYYSLEDIDRFRAQQKRAMRWEYRDENPYMSDSLKSNNRWLRDLEQLLMNDALEQLHTGMLTIGSEDLGIEDMEWVVSRPQPTCDECTVRDGLTMKEIKRQIKDEFADQPPPLHPNCRCQLVPKISDEWSKKNLTRDNFEWDPDSGTVFNPTDNQRENGFKDMTFDDYLDSVRGVENE